ncbi:unnamed protein product [Closterium sp. Yama58-4]|nr:unnamed protein product [Closterium sp. Yama58-4]
MASSPSPRPGSSLSFHAPPSGSTCIGSRRESSKHGDPASLSASPLNRVEENIGRLSAESFMTQRCTGGGHPRHSSTLTLASASFADNAGPSSPDEVPVRIGSSIASKFTPEKARLLRQKMRESESYHDRMYHSALSEETLIIRYCTITPRSGI